jgi:hypothetical protein
MISLRRIFVASGLAAWTSKSEGSCAKKAVDGRAQPVRDIILPF